MLSVLHTALTATERQMWMNAIRAQELSKHVVRVHDSLYVQPPARTQTDKCIVSQSKYVRDISTWWSSDFPRNPTQLPSFLFAQREHEALRGNFHSLCNSLVVNKPIFMTCRRQFGFSFVGASAVGLCLNKNIESELRYRETSDNPNNKEPQLIHKLSTLSEVWLGVRVKGWANRGRRGNQLFFYCSCGKSIIYGFRIIKNSLDIVSELFIFRQLFTSFRLVQMSFRNNKLF